MNVGKKKFLIRFGFFLLTVVYFVVANFLLKGIVLGGIPTILIYGIPAVLLLVVIPNKVIAKKCQTDFEKTLKERWDKEQNG